MSWRLKSCCLILLLSLPALAAWKLSWKPFTLKSRSGNLVYTGRIPSVAGLGKVNGLLRAFVVPANVEAREQEDRAFYAGNHFKEEISVEVTLLDERYLSLQRSNLGMLQREAHPAVDYAGLTVDLTAGRAVGLPDLLKPGWEKELPGRIQAAGRQEVPDLELAPRTRWDFVLTKEGLRFLNLVEGHAMASFTVTLSWKELADLRG